MRVNIDEHEAAIAAATLDCIVDLCNEALDKKRSRTDIIGIVERIRITAAEDLRHLFDYEVEK